MQYNGENLERCDKKFVRKNNKEKKIPKQLDQTDSILMRLSDWLLRHHNINILLNSS